MNPHANPLPNEWGFVFVYGDIYLGPMQGCKREGKKKSTSSLFFSVWTGGGILKQLLINIYTSFKKRCHSSIPLENITVRSGLFLILTLRRSVARFLSSSCTLVLGGPKFPAKKRIEYSSTAWQGLIKHVRKQWRSISERRRGHLDFGSVKVQKIRRCPELPRNPLVSEYDQLMR